MSAGTATCSEQVRWSKPSRSAASATAPRSSMPAVRSQGEWTPGTAVTTGLLMPSRMGEPLSGGTGGNGSVHPSPPPRPAQAPSRWAGRPPGPPGSGGIPLNGTASTGPVRHTRTSAAGGRTSVPCPERTAREPPRIPPRPSSANATPASCGPRRTSEPYTASKACRCTTWPGGRTSRSPPCTATSRPRHTCSPPSSTTR